jgi:exodeoxyribonuclease III
MKIISYNVNGIRAALKKGLAEFIARENAEIVCLQEVRASACDFDATKFHQLGYHCHWHGAAKKGYSGVAILSKIEPNRVQTGMGDTLFDAEGRTIMASFDAFTVVNTYFPSGTSGEERQKLKYRFLDLYLPFIQKLKRKNKNLVVLGDYNIAHTEIDIHDPKGNKNNSGFLPEERNWMSQWFASGMLDSYRFLNPDTKHIYTWWSQRSPSVRLNNKGWRIDYISVSDRLKDHLQSVATYPLDRQSDHCALSVTMDF